MTVPRTFRHDSLSTMPWFPYPSLPPWQSKGLSLGSCFRSHQRLPFDAYGGQSEGKWGSNEHVFAGLKGGGKTTGMKYYALISAALQAIALDGTVEDIRMVIDNRKIDEGDEGEEIAAEWQEIVDFMACETFRVRDMRLEPLSGLTYSTEADLLIAARDITESRKAAALDIDELVGLRVVIYFINQIPREMIGLMSTALRSRQLTRDDVVKYLDRSKDQVAERFSQEIKDRPELKAELDKLMVDPGYNVNIDDVLAGATRIAKYLLMVLDAEFGQTFAGAQSLADYMREPASMFDMTGMDDMETAFFETQRFNTMSARLAVGDISCIPHIRIREEVQEEGGHGDNDLVKLRAEAFWNAKARAFHSQSLSSTQYLNNMMHGEPDSRERRYAEQIFNGTDFFWIFQQSDDPATRELLRSIHLTPNEIEMSMGLPTGCCILKPRNMDPVYLQIHIPEIMKRLVRSRSASQRMMRRVPLLTHPHVIARQKASNQA